MSAAGGSRCVAVALALALLLPGVARAGGDTHYQDYIVGERAGGMGGAFTAIANEATGAYYNPAGIISESSALLQLSMSAYKLRQLRVQVADICNSKFYDDRSAFFGFPGSLGIVKQFQTGSVRHAVGFTLVVSHWDRSRQGFGEQKIRCGKLDLSVGLSAIEVDRVFWSGLSYAIQPWKFLQFGVTVGFNVRSYTYSELVTVVTDLKGIYPALTYFNGEVAHWSLFAQAGVIVSPTDRLRLGLSFTSPRVRLSGAGRLDLLSAEALPTDAGDSVIMAVEDAEYYWKVPFKLALGGAYTFDGALTLALDVSLHGTVENHSVIRHAQISALGLTDEIPRNERRWVVNTNLGAEWMPTAKLALRGGLFTNLTSYPDRFDDFDHVQRFGATLGVAYASSPFSALALGVQAQLGELRTEATNIRATQSEDDLVTGVYDAKALDFSLVVSIGGGFDIH